MQSTRFAQKLVIGLALLLTTIAPAYAIPQLLIDAKTLQVLYAEDAGQPWHPASVTKLMTAYLAFAAIKDGRVTLDTPVTISQHAWNQAPAKSGLAVGQSVTLKDALYIMLVKSANDMAVAVAETVGGSEKAFVAQMNLMAQQMGMTATHYDNANGLKSPGQISTARDLAIIALYVERDFPQYMPIFQTQAVQLGDHKLEASNTMLEHFAGLTGMKTGYICESGLNIVATLDRNGRQLLAVVLGASSARERNELAAQMFLRGLSGALTPTGQTLLDIKDLDAKPVDMSPLICGKKAKAYIKKRMAAFPMGLKGKPSYLTDKIEGPTYIATELGAPSTTPVAPGTATTATGDGGPDTATDD
ncbi:MAG TPA: D-alanyl-D-alanine carboxypeptidase family protein [Devosia sp.]|jgi:D-alanyl-D-alanine carboxypeptidase|nr:D-alanyl-D-alanine carboxypeptidase family protein [Devosia sp.]